MLKPVLRKLTGSGRVMRYSMQRCRINDLHDIKKQSLTLKGTIIIGVGNHAADYIPDFQTRSFGLFTEGNDITRKISAST